MVPVAVPPCARQRDFAQPSRIEILALGFQVMLARALLHPHLADAVIDARCLDDARPFFRFERERLLDVDVFARVERVDPDGRVPVIGHGDQRGVHLFKVEHLAVVVKRARVGTDLLRLVELVVPDIAERDNVDAEFHEIREVAASALAAADERHLDAVVRAHHARVRECGSSGYAPQEGAPCDVVVWHISHCVTSSQPC